MSRFDNISSIEYTSYHECVVYKEDVLSIFMFEDNLARPARAVVKVSIATPTGGAARDPNVLLNEVAHHLDDQPLSEFSPYRTYDTYDGQNQADTPDWYVLQFIEQTTVNCIEMTMGIPYRDGGWWTSLQIEFYHESTGTWQNIKHLFITPPYDFKDRRKQRRPFETYALIFEEVTTRQLRLIGMPGGIAHFTSLARLAAYHRNLNHWDPTRLPPPPVPHLFRLIPPQLFFDLSQSLTKLTGLTLNIPYVEYYLDELRLEKHWQMRMRNYQGEPKLWFFLGDTLGWHNWFQMIKDGTEILYTTLQNATVRTSFHGMLAYATAPILIHNQVFEAITTEPVLLQDHFDKDWHQRYAHEHHLPWDTYKAALDRTPCLTLTQLEGAAELLSMIIGTIVNATRHTLNNSNHFLQEQHSSIQHKDMIREAIDYMQDNVENSIDVAGVARHLGISSSHFCTLFSEHIGCSPGDYLIMLRLERAKRYLAHSHMSVTNVCVKLGYTPSHFSRLFKRYIGCTPRQFVQHARTHNTPYLRKSIP